MVTKKSPPHPPPRLHNFVFPTSGWAGGQILKTKSQLASIDGGKSDESERSVSPDKQCEEALVDLRISALPEEPENARLPQNLRRRAPFEEPENANLPRNLRRRASFEEPDNARRPQNVRTRESSEPSEDTVPSWNGKRPRERAPENKKIPWSLRGKSTSKSTPEKKDFSLTLSRLEIQEDLFLMTGEKPRVRPKNKHPKAVQKVLDRVFPGMGLHEVNPKKYEAKLK